VELLVSLALILFLMTIISEAFGAAATTFRNLKAIGDLCQKLRIASNMLRRDLAADHFEGRKRLSDPNFWQNGPPREGYFRIYQDTNPTLEGYDLDDIRSYISAHQIIRFTSKFHGNERDDYFVGTVPSNAPAPLSPTANGADSRYEDVNNTVGSGGQFLYQFRFDWAEIAYFLRPQVNPIGLVQDTANGQPLYALYRRQWLSCVDNYALNQTSQKVKVETVTGGLHPVTTQNMQFYLETSTMPDPAGTGFPLNSPNYFLYFNSPIDLTVPPRRMGTTTDQPSGRPPPYVAPSAPYVAFSPSALFTASSTLLSTPTLAEDVNRYSGSSNVLSGSDLLLTDVISMDVRVLLAGNTDFVSLDDGSVQAYASMNPNFNANATAYSSSSTTNKYLFDTWSSVTDDYYDFSDWSTGTNTTDHLIPLYQFNSSLSSTYPTLPPLISIKAIQVVIRIWDYKTNQARQVTVVQDL
jgi:hypothetical protein